MKPVYLDYHATAPVDPRVLEAMLPYFSEKFGNASSIDHYYGNEVLSAVQEARKNIAETIHVEEDEIIFTSGATEANNLALFGIAEQYKEKGRHIITCVTEHKAVLDPCKRLEVLGFHVTYLPVDKNGVVDLEKLEECITQQTILISIMAANNEIGTIPPLKKIGEIAHDHRVFFHTDAAQAYGHISLDVREMNIDLMSASGHKIYGPKGIGVLYARRKNPPVKLTPMIYGGGHERKLRAGTLNVPAIVGFGKASEIARKELKENRTRLKKLTDMLYEGIASKVGVKKNGDAEETLSHNLNLYFEGVDAKALINEVKHTVAISTGSACTTDELKPSHVITALGYDEERAHCSVRIGLGRFTTEAEIRIAIKAITQAVKKLRNM